MEPDINAFGHGATGTTLHPIILISLIITILLMWILPRKYVIVPFILCIFLSPVGQQLYVWGVHFYVPRLLILAGWIRISFVKLSSKSEIASHGFNVVDAAFICWSIFRAIAPVVTFHFDPGAAIYQGAFLWDGLGGYFLMRFLIQDEEDVIRVIKVLAASAAVLGITMLNEKLRNQNIFGYLGTISIVPSVREGSIRAQGTFEVSILAGVFGATLVPLFLWLWQNKKARVAAACGLVGSTLMTVSSASSTPLLAYTAAIVGLCLWPMRRKMRQLRYGLVAALILLHLIMKAPVWFLIAHVDLIAGNSGYHRAMLIDTFIRHFSDWWLIGTNQAATWGYEMDDMSNQFVAEGESGGLVTFICFILIISKSFGRLGTARKIIDGDRKHEWLLWLLGVAVFAHCVGYFGISYFDQTKISWYVLLAVIAAVTSPIIARDKLGKSEHVVQEKSPVFGRVRTPVPSYSKVVKTWK
jgi:hypothetical protein